MPLSNDDVAYLQQAWRSGRDAGARERAAEGAIGFSVAHVDKYSPDQAAWAARRFEQEQAWRRGYRLDARNAIRRMRYGRPTIVGADLARYFPRGGEEGEATWTGNIFVAQGLTNLISLWMGLTGTAINKLTLTGATSVVGVGTGTAAAATADVKMISDGGSAWYRPFDAASLGTTTTNGVVVGTCTFGSTEANFAWNEWGWFTGSGAITAGSLMTTGAGTPFGVASTSQMVNHKTNVNLGSKASGSSWVFSTTFTIS